MPKFRLLSDAFIAPYLLKEGTIVNYTGPYGLHLEPLDDEGAALREEYIAARPEVASAMNPVEMAFTSIAIVEEAKPVELDLVTAAEAQLTKATPGLTEGGTVPEDAKKK